MWRNERRFDLCDLVFFHCAALAGALLLAESVDAQTPVPGTIVQTIATSLWSPPSPDPAGITWRPDTEQLVTCDSKVDETPIFASKNLWVHSTTGVVAQTHFTNFSNEPTGIAGDPAGGRFWISDDNDDVIYEISLGPDGLYGTGDDLVVDLDGIRPAGCDDQKDVAYDNLNDVLYVLSGSSFEICKIEPGPNGEFDGMPPTGDDVMSLIDIGLLPDIKSPRGIVHDPFQSTLVVADRSDFKDLYELALDGTLLRRIDVPYPLDARPSGVTIAPATPNPVIRAYYVTDSGAALANDGRIFEVIAPPRSGNAAPVVDAGETQSLTFPAAANLAGLVSDDGHPYPPSAVAATWRQLSGPGVVSFEDASDPTTTASFSESGSYVLELVADDSALRASDTVAIELTAGAGGGGCGVGPELVGLLIPWGFASRMRRRFP